MYQRTQPEFRTLGAFLEHLRRCGDLVTVTVAAAVDPHLEITEIHRRTMARAGPALLFSNPTGEAALPIAVNLFGTPERVAAGLGTTPSGIAALGRFLAWLRAPMAPRSLAEARTLMPAPRAGLRSRPRLAANDPFSDLEPDFRHLPVQTCWPGDAGPLITWPIVVTRPPGAEDIGRYNLGIYRMRILDGSRAILRWLPMRGGAGHHRQWAALGADMPVAVVVGADPATMLLVLVDRTPVDHLDFASALPGLGGKLGIDATTKIGAEARTEYAATIMPDAEVVERVSRRRHRRRELRPIYGLPKQTPSSCIDTVDRCLELRPDRFSVLGYAHLPQFKKHQRRIAEEDLPDGASRHAHAEAMAERPTEAGYVRIGLDHLARPDDPMTRALAAGALRLDRAGEAEMSCIAGIGGDVPSLVKLATSGRPIVAIDGCLLRCVRRSLARHGVEPAVQIVLTDLGVKKRFHAGFDEAEAVHAYRRTVAALAARSPGAAIAERADRP